jgi:hypothetical protein
MAKHGNFRHRCGVCWEWDSDHAAWLKHVTEQHGSVIAEFGHRECRDTCVGFDHARRLRNEGNPPVKRARPEPQPYKAHDGTTYTPVPLPLDAA